MDSKIITEILKMVGLPGIIIVGWVLSALSGKGGHDNIVVWGGALAASIFVNFFVFQLNTWKESIVSAVKEEIDTTQLQSSEAIEVLATTQHQMVLSLANVMAVQDGGLTLSQIRSILGFLCDAFKWRTWQICLGSLDNSVLKTVMRDGLQSAVEVQITAMLRQLARYNEVLNSPQVIEVANKAVSNIFDCLYNPDLVQNENFGHRVRTVIEAIRREYDICSVQIGAFIDQKKTEVENATTVAKK